MTSLGTYLLAREMVRLELLIRKAVQVRDFTEVYALEEVRDLVRERRSSLMRTEWTQRKAEQVA